MKPEFLQAPSHWYGPDAEHLITANNNKEYFKECMTGWEDVQKEHMPKGPVMRKVRWKLTFCIV